jgi:hypothetical protein
VLVLQYAITGLGTAICRHGFVLKLLNIFTGERHAYATMVMQCFLFANIAVLFLWYDIACRWSKSFAKWLEKQPERIRALGAATRCLIPPWHVFAHR